MNFRWQCFQNVLFLSQSFVPVIQTSKEELLVYVDTVVSIYDVEIHILLRDINETPTRQFRPMSDCQTFCTYAVNAC